MIMDKQIEKMKQDVADLEEKLELVERKTNSYRHAAEKRKMRSVIRTEDSVHTG